MEFKDAFMLLKAIEKTCKDIYDAKSEIIVRQLENSTDRQYKGKYGLFSLKTNNAKTIKEYTEEEKIEFDKIQNQIDALKLKQDRLGTEKIVKDKYNSLVYRKNAQAEEKANKLLENIIIPIGNATMIKASRANDKAK